jgi:AbrB family looped-hinge helix DNA binding protein
MSVATMTSKGQTTIPKDIREAMGLKPKDQISFTLMPDGAVIMRAKTRSIGELYGALHEPDRAPLALDNMKAGR